MQSIRWCWAGGGESETHKWVLAMAGAGHGGCWPLGARERNGPRAWGALQPS